MSKLVIMPLYRVLYSQLRCASRLRVAMLTWFPEPSISYTNTPGTFANNCLPVFKVMLASICCKATTPDHCHDQHDCLCNRNTFTLPHLFLHVESQIRLHYFQLLCLLHNHCDNAMRQGSWTLMLLLPCLHKPAHEME